jgi:hypothetical protein
MGLDALATTLHGSTCTTPRIYCLWLGLLGYLIPFAPLAFVSQCVGPVESLEDGAQIIMPFVRVRTYPTSNFVTLGLLLLCLLFIGTSVAGSPVIRPSTSLTFWH